MVAVLFIFLSPTSSVQGQIPSSSPIVTPSGISIRDAIESDVNGDGHLDLVSVNGQGEITISFGFGTGAHGNRQQIDPGPGIDAWFDASVRGTWTVMETVIWLMAGPPPVDQAVSFPSSSMMEERWGRDRIFPSILRSTGRLTI